VEAKGAELLARCSDIFLKKNSKVTYSEQEFEDKLNSIVKIHQYFLFEISAF